MPNEVEQIKQRLDIVEVIGEYVRLKQSGQNWKGLCPFHGEKTPSFMAHREKQIWHCFGCGLGGDVFEFVQKIENIDFPEALELLARRAGVELAPRGRGAGQQSQRQRLFEAMGQAAAFYHGQLKSTAGLKARQYLGKRGITEDSISTFGLGYSLPEWDKVMIHLRGRGFTPEEVVAAGLALKGERGPGWYDRFRDRLMFPIADAQGRVVGFGGRTLPTGRQALEAEAKEAKYINSPQGSIYNKSLVLYNLERAKQYIKEAAHAVLVEGYMDVIGSWQAGVRNVVSVSGTALTPEQVKLIKRYTNEIRIAFDADLAGQSASERGIDLALQAELEVKVINLPLGKDPDECARQDAAAFRAAVAEALPIGDYAFAKVLSEVDVTTREGKKLGSRRLLPMIAKLPDPVERDHYLKRLSRELGVDELNLREKLLTVVPAWPTKAEPAILVAAPTATADRHQLLSERLLALVVRSVEHLDQLAGEFKPEMLAGEDKQELYRRMIVFYTERRHLDFDEFKLELASSVELVRLLDRLWLQAEGELAEFDATVVQQELNQLTRSLKLNHLSSELKQLSQAIRQAEQAGQTEELHQHLERFVNVSRQITQLQESAT